MGLSDEQKGLVGQPVVTLTVGAHSLDAYVWGYRYEEVAEESGGLTLWLDNRGNEFDDLSTDYADLVRGAAIDLRRGLPVGGVDTTEKLPRTWIEGLRYVFIEGAALLRLDCIDWREKLRRFRYATAQSWNATEVATIIGSILGEVGLTLASGSFSFSTDFAVSVRRDGMEAVRDLMERVDEYLYAGDDGEILHKALDPAEEAGYDYDWSTGDTKHPLMQGSEVAETSPKFNKVAVKGGPAGEYSGSAEDATESALMGTRLRTVIDKDLGSNDQCTERARAELRFWQSQTVYGSVVARPHFTLQLYDVVSVAAPSWGGPAIAAARVRQIIEEYGRGEGLWEQRLTVGGVSGLSLPSSTLTDGVIAPRHLDDDAVDTDAIRPGAVATATLAADAVTSGKIAADAVLAEAIATDAVTADAIAANAVVAGKIAADAVVSDSIAALAVLTAKLAAGAVTADKLTVSTLSAIAADMGTLTAGVIKMGTGTKDVDLDGFQLDSGEIVGQEGGVDQVTLSASDGKITAGAGNVVADADGLHVKSGVATRNKHRVMDGTDIIAAWYGEIEEELGASVTMEAIGKDATSPEALFEFVAITYDGTPASGVASVSFTLNTETGVIEFSGAVQMRMGETYFEMTEQSGADPAAPGANRCRLFVRDNGGKSELCARFPSGAIQQVAIEP